MFCVKIKNSRCESLYVYIILFSMSPKEHSTKDTYLIVELKEEVSTEFPSRIMCIYSSWMQDDKMRYKGPPYDQDGLDAIESFLKTKSSPPDSWPEYSCRILEEIGKIARFFHLNFLVVFL